MKKKLFIFVFSLVDKLRDFILQFEMSEPGELTEQALMDELYPKKVESKKFAKPKRRGQGRRGPVKKFQM